MANLSELYVELMVNGINEMVSDLKRVQREAKKATQSLRELETYYTDALTNERFYVKWKQSQDDECTDIREVCMSEIPTEYLQRELAKRNGGKAQ